MALSDRLKSAWNAFRSEERRRETDPLRLEAPYGVGARPDIGRLRRSNERSIIASIYTRLGIDVASHDIRHVRLDDEGRYLEDVVSGLNNCLTLEANIDQAARAFRQDVAMTLFDRGVVAIVPVDTTSDPTVTGSYDIQTMRIGEIMSWYPEHVRVNLWNQQRGMKQDVILPKSVVAIIENPLYSVMNEPNSTLQRLIRTLNNLDAVDAQSASGKLDIIIQLPYVIKSDARREQAEKRRKDIEFQLKGSQYGIAYTDGTEKITQLNRASENNLMKQVEYLTTLLYSQLGLTDEIMAGTADEKAMLNYENRTVEPILAAIAEAMKRTFLTKTARTQGQSVKYFTDPFRLVPLSAIAEIADKFTRNEILSSNEIRQIIGTKPSKDPKADELHNSNMPRVDSAGPPPPTSPGNGESAEHSFQNFSPALAGSRPSNGHSGNRRN
jgi:hypothetical protein